MRKETGDAEDGQHEIGKEIESMIEKKSLLPDNKKSSEKEQVHNLFYSNLANGSTIGKQLSSNRERAIVMNNPSSTKKQSGV